MTKPATAMMEPGDPFDLIELGAGDCQKSAYLLQQLVRAGAGFTYMPIDISSNGSTAKWTPISTPANSHISRSTTHLPAPAKVT